jgi:hypothetical protein
MGFTANLLEIKPGSYFILDTKVVCIHLIKDLPDQTWFSKMATLLSLARMTRLFSAGQDFLLRISPKGNT